MIYAFVHIMQWPDILPILRMLSDCSAHGHMTVGLRLAFGFPSPSNTHLDICQPGYETWSSDSMDGQVVVKAHVHLQAAGLLQLLSDKSFPQSYESEV